MAGSPHSTGHHLPLCKGKVIISLGSSTTVACLFGVQCLEEAGTNQVLIFVHSRKETYKTAKFLQEEAMRNDDLAKFVPGSSASREVLQVRHPWHQ